MSDARLKTRIRQLFKEHLEPKGFLLTKKRIPERFLPGLRQGIEFQPGYGHLEGRYTLNIFWSFLTTLDDGNKWDGSRRIGELLGCGDVWFSREESELERDFAVVSDHVRRVVLPYLDKYSSIVRILEEVGQQFMLPSHAFGLDPGWQCFNKAYCRAFVGETERAIDLYRRVVVEYSNGPYEWVHERKRAALAEIQKLGGAGSI